MSIHQKIKSGIKEATLAKDAVKLSVLRSLQASFMNELAGKGKNPGGELSDDEALSVLKRSAKQRKDSIEQFKKGNREDLVSAETAELAIVETFLPKMMDKEEIKKIAEVKIREMGADKAKVGQIIGAVVKECKGMADGGAVKVVVDNLLK